MEFNKVFEEYLDLYTEAKEAPKGKHYDSAGRLRSGDADADGRGGPKYRSDPTYKNPNEDGESRKPRKSTHWAAILGAAEHEADKKAEAEGKKEKPKKKYLRPETQADLAARMSAPKEDAEDISGDKVDEFHKALDELIHKYLGHSSAEDGTHSEDAAAEEDAEKIDKDRMKCNKPRRTSGGSKKFVVKACKDGKEKIVRYGDPNMKIKKSNPKRRKSFRARHKCDQKKDKFSAGYWSCRKW